MSDLISREALLDYLQIVPIDLGYREVDDITEYVKKMPTAQPDNECKKCVFAPFKQFRQQWIPCSERLPERDKRVLVTVFGDYDIGYIDTDPDNMQLRWCFESFNLYGDEMEDVKAWMPLPEPYREETNNEM